MLSVLRCAESLQLLNVRSVSYQATMQNYRAFTEAVRSAVDLHRFNLLQALHIALPKDSTIEKRIWEQIMSPASTSPISYVQPPPAP